MTNCRVLWDDKMPLATLSTPRGEAGPAPGLTLDGHLQYEQPSALCRWLGTRASVMADFGASTSIGAVVLAMTNLTAPSVRVRVGSDPLEEAAALLELHSATATDNGAAPAGSFARASAATCRDAAGLLVTRAAGWLRLDHDPASLARRGWLLEEARTNLLWPSNDFSTGWSRTRCAASPGATAPDGAASGRLTADGSGAFVNAARSVTVAGSTQYVLSAYLRAGTLTQAALRFQVGASAFRGRLFDLSSGALLGSTDGTAPDDSGIEAAGNGWWRCWVKVTTEAAFTAGLALLYLATGGSIGGTPAAGSHLDAFGAQLEAGAFLTSYIPTTSAAVTRQADVWTVPTSAIAGFNAAEGTIAIEASRPVFGSTYPWPVALDDGTAANRIGFFQNDNGTSGTEEIFALVRAAGVTAAQLAGPVMTAGTLVRAAMVYKANDFASSFNGGSVATDTSGAVGSITRICIGGGDVVWNGHIKRLRLYGSRLSNAQLQALSGSEATSIVPSYDATFTPTPGENGNCWLQFAAPQSGRYLRLDVTQAGTAIDIGVLMAGPVWTTSRNFSWGAMSARMSMDEAATNRWGGLHGVEGARPRRHQLNFQMAPDGDYEQAQAMWRACGKLRNVALCLFPARSDSRGETIVGTLGNDLEAGLMMLNGTGYWNEFSLTHTERL